MYLAAVWQSWCPRYRGGLYSILYIDSEAASRPGADADSASQFCLVLLLHISLSLCRVAKVGVHQSFLKRPGRPIEWTLDIGSLDHSVQFCHEEATGLRLQGLASPRAQVLGKEGGRRPSSSAFGPSCCGQFQHCQTLHTWMFLSRKMTVGNLQPSRLVKSQRWIAGFYHC